MHSDSHDGRLQKYQDQNEKRIISSLLKFLERRQYRYNDDDNWKKQSKHKRESEIWGNQKVTPLLNKP